MEVYQRLEHEIAEWAGYRPEQVVCCSTGSAALHLALEAFRLPLGSEVLCPDFTFIACARAITLAGLKPVFVDCDERLLMDLSLVKQDYKAAMLVHIHGRQIQIPDRPPWYFQIEDLSQAHGVKPHPSTDAACWSFNRTKVIGGEEGGAVAFRDQARAAHARLLRSQGNRGDWDHAPRGMNYRMQNCAAELIRESLFQFTMDRSLTLTRREIEAWYDEWCPVEWRMPYRDVPWVYDFRVRDPYLSRALRRGSKELLAAGVELRQSFRPMRLQPEYGLFTSAEAEQSNIDSQAYRAFSEVFALPIRPGVTTRESARRAFDGFGLLLAGGGRAGE